MKWTPAGQFDKRVELQRPKSPADRGTTGEVVPDYIPYATVWARFRTLSGQERTASEQVAATLTHEVTIRYRAGVTPRDRLVLVGSGRIFDVKDLRDVDEAHVEIRMRCVEVL